MALLDQSLHRTEIRRLLSRLGIAYEQSGVAHEEWTERPSGEAVPILSPADGAELATVLYGAEEDYDDAVYLAQRVWPSWRDHPAPRRGLILREIADALRSSLDDLATLVALESGKILAEAKGEVQEMIDVADFAVGLSRQLYGLTMPSERPGHRIMEQWHPLGVVGCITAFNFPVAVWSWNAFLAAVCGNCVVWKPSEKTPLSAIAVHKICEPILARHGFRGVFTLVCGTGSIVGERMTADRRLPLISATGSSPIGRRIAEIVGGRLGRSLLELGGNNAAIVAPSADIELTTRGVTFSAAGTAGQRCTTLRRLIVHRSRLDEVLGRLAIAFNSLPIGSPLDASTLVGPLITTASFDRMRAAIGIAEGDGGMLAVGGERLLAHHAPNAAYTRPAIVVMPQQTEIANTEYQRDQKKGGNREFDR